MEQPSKAASKPVVVDSSSYSETAGKPNDTIAFECDPATGNLSFTSPAATKTADGMLVARRRATIDYLQYNLSSLLSPYEFSLPLYIIYLSVSAN